MALFQNSVLNKYLKLQDDVAVEKAFKKYAKYFHNPTIQQNIREAKEEQYQAKFLDELFVTVFDYTLYPKEPHNLITELKNEKGAKKADGAILKDGNAFGVIELKGTNTKDLEKVRQQAFDYKANQTGCLYVITSNFEKLRFYINNAVDFEEFNLFTLTQEQFALLYLCLHQSNLLNNIPLKIKNDSVVEEEKITKTFYNDYSLFKRELYRDLVKQNMKNEVFRAELNNQDTEQANKNIKLALFKKSQKLIDRFLFIFFAEDRGLLPPNSTLKILEQWDKLKDLDAYTPLYERYKLYFKYLDTGRKGTDKTSEIFAYNGGLFKPDAILDSLIISDELLYQHTKTLSIYDFDSQVDVNILGHIFENSLNEIESINAEIEGVEFDKQKTKRKKDGVFYTPKYITKYIVDNTIGKLCTEKKDELNIQEEDYLKSRKGRTTKKLKELQEKLETYRQWLLHITICDPACGSGAFLNQALDFLIKEHQYIDELQTNLLGGGFVFPDIENTVLENNIFGVDLNEESIEIAKLSLWLRTAQPRRKLNNLSSNIKCGNSLIDSKTVAGDKAFKWEEEFPQIFNPSLRGTKQSGFDVVIGNPPYLVVKGGRWVGGFQYDKNAITLLKNQFETASQQINTYNLFLELGIKLTKINGIISQITPNTFLANEYSQKLREYLVNNSTITEIFNSGLVFDDASVETAVITYINTKNHKASTNIKLSIDEIPLQLNLLEIMELTEDSKFLININDKTINLLTKLSKLKKIKSVAKVWRGLTTGNDKEYLTETKETEKHKTIISGSEVGRYFLKSNQKYVYYVPELLDRARDERIFLLSEKLISKFVGDKLTFCYDNRQNYVINTACSTEILDNNIKPFYLLAILNSKLINFYFQQVFSDSRSTFPIMKSGNIEDLPIILIDNDGQKSFIDIVENIISFATDFQKKSDTFSKYLQSQFQLEKLSKKLQNWHELEFGDFIKELNKAIKKVGGEKLTKSDEMDWMDVFETKKAEAQTLKTQIDKTDAEIDKMVYELYGLSEEEIKIVEGV
jgi:hypothetical protein